MTETAVRLLTGTEPFTIAVLSVLFASTLVRSTFGFGDALVAMPLLSLFVNVTFAAPLVALVSVVIAAAILLTDWHRVEFRAVGRLVVWAALGVPIGRYGLTELDESTLKTGLAVIIIGFSVHQLVRPERFSLGNDKTAGLFGFAAGVLGGAYNTHGPPLVIYGALRNWSAERFRATMQGYFLPVGLMVLVAHVTAGLWTPAVLRHFGCSLPIVAAAILLGRRLSRLLGNRNFTPYIYSILIVSGMLLLIRSVPLPRIM